MRLGVVGCGLIAQLVHLPALASLSSRFAVVAVADPSERARTALAEQYGVANAYARHEDLLQNAGVDAVLVASPNGTHARVALDALAADAHVLVEKPLCLTATDATRIVERAAGVGRVVQVGYMKRFDAAYEAMRELAPAPGDLRLISSVTVDPGIERALPAGRLRGGDRRCAGRPRRPRARDRRAGRDRGGIGRPAPRARVLGRVPRRARPRRQPRSRSAGRPGRRGGRRRRQRRTARSPSAPCAVASSARWTAAWMLLPGAARFREELRLFADDGVAHALVRRAVRPGPHAPETSTATRRASVRAPTATHASSSTSTTASPTARPVARRPNRARATSNC